MEGGFDVYMLRLFFNGDALGKALVDILGEALREVEGDVEGKVYGPALGFLLCLVNGQRVGPHAE